LNSTLDNFYSVNGLNAYVCQPSSVVTTWYVDIRLNGVPLTQYPFFNGIGNLSAPTDTQWVTALEDVLDSLLTLGYSYNIDTDNDLVQVYSNNCQPNSDDFQINVGISFELYCNN
jgi:hypothetical protein